MKIVENYEQHQRLVEEVRSVSNKLISNCYRFREEIERYIAQARFFYITLEKGVLFLLDEGRYYEANFYLTQYNLDWVKPIDKPIMIKLLYTKSSDIQKLSEALRCADFQYVDTLLHTKADPQEAIPRFEKNCENIEKKLLLQGFSYGPVPMQELETVQKFLEQIAEIPFYQRHFHSKEEYREDIRKKRFFSIISPEGEMCAAQYFAGDDKTFYGILGIKEKYRALYGMIMLLSMYGWKYAKEHNLQEYGWIREDNVESIRYHEKTGWKWTGRKMDEWILEAL